MSYNEEVLRLAALEAEQKESLPDCSCIMCKMFPVTQEEYDSLHQ